MFMTYYTYVVIGFGAELCTHTHTDKRPKNDVCGRLLYFRAFTAFLMVEKEGV